MFVVEGVEQLAHDPLGLVGVVFSETFCELGPSAELRLLQSLEQPPDSDERVDVATVGGAL